MKPLHLPFTKRNPGKKGMILDIYTWKTAKRGVKKSAESKKTVQPRKPYTIADVVAERKKK